MTILKKQLSRNKRIKKKKDDINRKYRVDGKHAYKSIPTYQSNEEPPKKLLEPFAEKFMVESSAFTSSNPDDIEKALV